MRIRKNPGKISSHFRQSHVTSADPRDLSLQYHPRDPQCCLHNVVHQARKQQVQFHFGMARPGEETPIFYTPSVRVNFLINSIDESQNNICCCLRYIIPLIETMEFGSPDHLCRYLIPCTINHSSITTYHSRHHILTGRRICSDILLKVRSH